MRSTLKRQMYCVNHLIQHEKYHVLRENLFENPFEKPRGKIFKSFDIACEKLNENPCEKPNQLPVSHVLHLIIPPIHRVRKMLIYIA